MMSFKDTIAAVLDGRLAPLRLELQRLAAEVSDLRQALPPLLVSVPLAAERLGVSLSTARRRVRDGEWPVRRDGRRVLVDLGTLRAGFEDASRWRKHLAPYFEHLRPARVDAARIRAFIEAKLAQKANPATVRIYIALLSALFADLFERGIAQSNPARGLPRST